MPYINPSQRQEVFQYGPQTPGELNYAITNLIDGYMTSAGLSYDVINVIMGVLEGAKAEFYRRVAAPYEDRKLAENGDVYAPAHVADPQPKIPMFDSPTNAMTGMLDALAERKAEVKPEPVIGPYGQKYLPTGEHRVPQSGDVYLTDEGVLLFCFSSHPTTAPARDLYYKVD